MRVINDTKRNSFGFPSESIQVIPDSIHNYQHRRNTSSTRSVTALYSSNLISVCSSVDA